jgi:hypothetical protein
MEIGSAWKTCMPREEKGLEVFEVDVSNEAKVKKEQRILKIPKYHLNSYKA